MGEILLIAIVALLALGPDRLPEAAKKIGETIRGLRRQTSDLRKTIEEDTQLGDAMRELRSALREDPTKPKKAAKPSSAPSDGPAPDEPPPEEPLIQPADDAVAVGDVINEVAKGAEGSAEGSAENTDGAENGAGNAASAPDEPVQAYAKQELSEYERYIHNNGTEAASEKFGTSIEHAEAAMMASLERTSQNG